MLSGQVTKFHLMAAAALIGLGYANWRTLSETIDVTPLAPVEENIPAPESLVEPTQKLQNIALADLNETLSRPLFYAGRRPPARPVSNAQTALVPNVEQRETAASVQNADLRLLGVLHVANAAPSVLIQSSNGSPAKWRAIGGEIDGWRVTNISADHVTVESSGTRSVLKLHPPRAAGSLVE